MENQEGTATSMDDPATRVHIDRSADQVPMKPPLYVPRESIERHIFELHCASWLCNQAEHATGIIGACYPSLLSSIEIQ